MGNSESTRLRPGAAGPTASVFIIAEAGVNHNGDLGMAKQLIDVAAKAGVDAVKFQTFNAERLATAKAPKARYQLAGTGKSESQLDMLRKLELSRQAHHQLAKYATRRGVTFLSTPFDEQSADLLDELGIPLFKIGSGEITNLPFLAHVGQKRKPVILSTGMSSLGEVEEALRVLRQADCPRVTLLHCTSNYPADPAMCNLKAIQTLQAAFDVPVGYSDHTEGIAVAVAAVALGACVVEKHFTLDQSLPGPDHRASLEPEELKAFVQAIRKIESALGDGEKRSMPTESNTRDAVRRSLVAACDLPAGTVLRRQHVACKRPGTGIAPADLPQVIGHTLVRSLSADEMIGWSDLS